MVSLLLISCCNVHVRLPVPPGFAVSLLFLVFTYKEGFGFVFCGGRYLPLFR